MKPFLDFPSLFDIQHTGMFARHDAMIPIGGEELSNGLVFRGPGFIKSAVTANSGAWRADCYRGLRKRDFLTPASVTSQADNTISYRDGAWFNDEAVFTRGRRTIYTPDRCTSASSHRIVVSKTISYCETSPGRSAEKTYQPNHGTNWLNGLEEEAHTHWLP